MEAFSSNETEVMGRRRTVESNRKNPADIEVYFEIKRCADFLNENDFKRVALQFPDDLLGCSGAVVSELEKRTSARLFVLGDTSYGSCCVDEVTAEHAEADSIIHFGRACLSPTSRLPVLYVFGQHDLDISHCVQSFKEILQDPDQPIILLYDVVYAHKADDLALQLSAHFTKLASSHLEIPDFRSHQDNVEDSAQIAGLEGNFEDTPINKPETSKTTNSDEATETKNICICKFGRTISLGSDQVIEEYSIFYIGAESLTLINLMMTFNRCSFFTYNPESRTARKENLNVNRKLMKRYYLIEKAKDANVVGILVGTLGVSKYLEIISQLKAMIKKAGKKYYTFVVGKLNVAKLANLMEVEVYVLVACPENSLVESQEFYQPIVTPFEMEIACNQSREWTGEYVTDFRELLPGASEHVPFQESFQREADMSLITGKIRSMSSGAAEEKSTETTAIVKRDDALIVSNVHHSAGEFLTNRSWQGLETKMGQTEVKDTVEGTKGIAASYSHEEDGTPV